MEDEEEDAGVGRDRTVAEMLDASAMRRSNSSWSALGSLGGRGRAERDDLAGWKMGVVVEMDRTGRGREERREEEGEEEVARREERRWVIDLVEVGLGMLSNKIW